MRREPRAPKLTKQERRILRLACRHLLDEEIANELNITLNTVASHWRSIRLKMNCESKVQAIIRAFEMGVHFPTAGSMRAEGHVSLPVVEVTGPLAELIVEGMGLPCESGCEEPVHLLLKCMVSGHYSSDQQKEDASADTEMAAERRADHNR